MSDQYEKASIDVLKQITRGKSEAIRDLALDRWGDAIAHELLALRAKADHPMLVLRIVNEDLPDEKRKQIEEFLKSHDAHRIQVIEDTVTFVKAERWQVTAMGPGGLAIHGPYMSEEDAQKAADNLNKHLTVRDNGWHRVEPVYASPPETLRDVLEKIGFRISAWIGVATQGVEAEGEIIDPPLGEPIKGFVEGCNEILAEIEVALTGTQKEPKQDFTPDPDCDWCRNPHLPLVYDHKGTRGHRLKKGFGLCSPPKP